LVIAELEMKFYQKLVLLISVLCMFSHVKAQILPSFGNSRTGTAGFQFLKIAPDARSASLAGSVAAFTNDLSSVYWNPAGLSCMDSNHYNFQIGHTLYFSGIEHNYAAMGYTKHFQNFWAFSVMSFNSGEMDMTTEFLPNGNNLKFIAGDFLAALSFAKILSDNFSFGLTSKYIEEDIAGIKARNGIIDIGFIYKIGFNGKTRFSAGISNFGFNISPSGSVKVSTLNGTKVYENFENIAVPAIFRMAISTVLYHNIFHHIASAVQLTHPTDNNETVSIGVEYSYKKFLFLRSGYEFGTDYQEWPSLGFGLRFQRYFGCFCFDYSFNNKNVFGNIHRITLGISIK